MLFCNVSAVLFSNVSAVLFDNAHTVLFSNACAVLFETRLSLKELNPYYPPWVLGGYTVNVLNDNGEDCCCVCLRATLAVSARVDGSMYSHTRTRGM